MIRSVVLIFLCFISQLCFSQKSRIIIDWKSPKTIFTYQGEKQVLTFVDAHYHKSNFLPQYHLEFPGKESLDKLTFSDLKYTELNEEEIRYLPKDFIRDSIFYLPEVKYENHKPIVLIDIVPFRFNQISKKFEKVLSFSYLATFKAKTSPQIKQLRNGREEEDNAANSVLSNGIWYKLEIPKTGIYKLDYKFLASLGIPVKNINPQNIKVYGNGGGMLPQANAIPRASDLIENPILLKGQDDGVLNPEDYALFYAKGPHEWIYSPAEEYINHVKNLYSEYAYYFLTVSDNPGKRIQEINTLPEASTSITEYDDYSTHELDLFNFFSSGRFWYGEQFSSTSNSRQVSLPCDGIVQSSPLKIRFAGAAFNESDSYFNVAANGFSLGSISVSRQGGFSGYPEGRTGERLFVTSADNLGNRNRVDFQITYNASGGAGAKAALDFISLNYKRQLKLYGKETFFRSTSSLLQPQSNFIIGDVPIDGLIWDVTNVGEIKSVLPRRNGSTISFTTETSELKEFVVLNGADFPTPKFVGTVANQNIRGISEVPNLVIVTHSDFYGPAQQLANFRQTNDGLTTLVVTTNQVYNEFSSGSQDVSAIRDLMKYFYNRDSKTDPKLKYLMLFGACSFDYKNRVSNNTNFVPVYETRNSLHEINSFSSDDYFGFLDNDEGEWQETFIADKMDIGVGRVPVSSLDQAQNIVNKIIAYQKSESAYGKWRNRVTFIADNGDYNSHASFPENTLQKQVKALHPTTNITKIYIDAFPIVSTPGGSLAPAAKQELINNFKSGSLIMNYSGHGGERGLAQEDILNVTDIAQLDNSSNYPFFVAATCDFGRYDNPSEIGGGVDLVMNPRGGSIGGIFSTRPVYQSSNETLNLEFFKDVFLKNDGQYPRLGDVIRNTKNNSISGVSNRNYALLGDPSMRLAYPKESIQITKINEKEFSGTDTLNALQKVSIAGEVHKDNSINESFTGTVYITVFDKVDSLLTIGPQPMPYVLQNSIIYDGEGTITNGRFNISFIVPKDISYNLGQGKISLYAKSTDVDAGGYNSSIIIGGSAANISPDNIAPEMNLFINDTTFKNGGLTHDHPLLIVKLKDESGINTSLSGIGHQITAILDDSKEVIVLNEYYSALKDTYKEGAIEYPFDNIAPGPHKLKVKAWDTHNNSVEQTIHFVVGEEKALTLEKNYAYPNPFSQEARFTFGHNKSGESLTVEINIHNLTGSLVKSFYRQYKDSPSTIDDIKWDGLDNAGSPIKQGMYVYKLNVGCGDGTEAQMIEKIIFLGQ